MLLAIGVASCFEISSESLRFLGVNSSKLGDATAQTLHIACLWRIDTVTVKRSDPRDAPQLRKRTPDDFILGFCRGRPDAAESLRNQAAAGV
jgi:hypothetical protein